MANYIPIFLVLFLVTTNCLLPSSAVSTKPFPCFFIFGDSLVDSGNNNELETSAKVDYSPYGVDFPYGPTGRFTNGLTTADFLAQMLGFDDFIPPFAETRGSGGIFDGVNYASGSAGIRGETGEALGVRVSLDEQLRNHETTVSVLANSYGNFSSAKQRLKKCFYYLVVGSNDYINNYFESKNYNTSRLYTPQQYATVLNEQLSHQLKKLYNLGARKIGVAGVGPLGCIPGMVASGGATNGSPCVDPVNDAVQLFNDGLIGLVAQLNQELANAKFVYIGAMDLRPTELFAPGIRLFNEACCRVHRSTGLCIEGGSPCAIRDVYFFYDYFHPTEMVNHVLATASYIDILKLV